MQYRSPAQMVLRRQLHDFLPVLLQKYEPTKDWSVTQEYRECTLAKKRESDGVRWTAKTKDLDEIEVGTHVAIQNQTGRNPNKWDNTGVVLGSKPNSQVLVRTDGSRRFTMRIRKLVKPLNSSLKKPGSPGFNQWRMMLRETLLRLEILLMM